MKKFVSFALAIALVCTLAAAMAGAAFAADKADITINGFNCPGNEGVTAVLTGETVGAELYWWYVLTFEPDSASGGYKCVDKKTIGEGEETGTISKKDMAIPAGGFAIGSNAGNDYPSIGQTDKPNYVTAANNAAFNAVQATEVGDIVYLVGVDLEKGTIDDNATDELLWYQDGYVSNAKLTFTKPAGATDESEGGDAPAGPVNAALGKSYTVKGILKDQAGKSNYPDEEGKSLTDGKGATQVGYGDAAWVGLNLNGEGMQTTDDFKDKSNIVVNLGESMKISKFAVELLDFKGEAGISLPASLEFFYSADGENWTSAGTGTPEVGSEVACIEILSLTLDAAVDATYVKAEFTHGTNWVFVSEFEAYTSGAGADTSSSAGTSSSVGTSSSAGNSSTPATGDAGAAALVIVAVVALAGAVAVKKVR